MLVWHAHDAAVTALAFAPDGRLLSAGADGRVKCWVPLGGQLVWDVIQAVPDPDRPPPLIRLAVAADSATAAVGHAGRGVGFLDPDTGGELARFAMSRLAAMAAAPDGRSVFVNGTAIRADGSRFGVFQLGYPRGRVLARSRGGLGRTGPLAVSPDGAQVVAGGVRLSWPAGTLFDGPGVHAGGGQQYVVVPAEDAVISPAGGRLSVAGLATGAHRKYVKGHVGAIAAVALTPDGRRLWTAAADAAVKCWDVSTMAAESTYTLRIGPLGSLAVSPDGCIAAAGGVRGDVAVWDLA